MNRHTRKTYRRRGALTLLVLIVLAMLSLLSVPLFAQPPAEGAIGTYPLPPVVGMSGCEPSPYVMSEAERTLLLWIVVPWVMVWMLLALLLWRWTRVPYRHGT